MSWFPARVLIADDESVITDSLSKALQKEKYEVFTAGGGIEACEVAEREQIHLALVDLTMPDRSGLEVLKHLRERNSNTRVIIMTAYASAETAVMAMKEGALDYLIKPFSLDEMKIQIRRAVTEMGLARENTGLRRQIELNEESIIGKSPAFIAALETARKAARGDTTVLLMGETGSGKEVLAREVHRASPRAEGPFLALNCGAIPESMIERELFGHEKGSFTGADSTRPGLVEAASEGTLFLDEVGELPPALQVKLLRVIEGHDFMRIGGTRPVKVRTRFIAASNRDLAKLSTEGGFRADLYHRLNIISITLPPLRQRGEDIQLLADYFLARISAGGERRYSGFTADARANMRSYPWPGNAREVRNVIERAVILGNGGELTATDLRLDGVAKTGYAMPAGTEGLLLKEARDSFERAFIERALQEEGGNISHTAERIGLDRKNLEDKIKKFGLKK